MKKNGKLSSTATQLTSHFELIFLAEITIVEELNPDGTYNDTYLINFL